MLRSASAAAVASGDRLGLASFPLVPYSNRIGLAAFRHRGEQIALTPNFPPEPHAIHGTGWEDCWMVASHSSDALVLSLDHSSDERWPWAFRAEQRISVAGDRLSLHLSATNLADRPVPLAFGHHPYFDSAGAVLQFDARQVWQNGADMLPTRLADIADGLDFSTAAAVAGRTVDHCYSEWEGSARIVWQDRSRALHIASDLPAATVYIPPNSDFFCFEPVPHSNDALNRADAAPAMPALAPGAAFTAQITFQAVPA